jgi:hypothetical protein
LPRHRLEQVAAREGGAGGFDRGLIFAGRMIGKSLPRRFKVDAFGGIARQTCRGLAVPGEIVAQHHAAPGGAVIGQQAIRQKQHDVALVGLARALLLEVLDLKHEVVGERTEQTEQGIVIGAERRHQVTHQRHHAGAAGALVFIDRRRATHDVAGETPGTPLGNDDAGLAQDVAEEGDQHFAARVQGIEKKIGSGGFQPQRRVGKAEVETLVAARHRGARRQHHAAAAIEQVDQVIEPVGAAGELLHRARHFEAAMAAIFAAGRQ